jgi:hypothetical protein
MGISVWGLDQADPFRTMPYPGTSWELQGKPACQPHQHLRNGTAKLMSLFHPATGEVRVKGVRSLLGTRARNCSCGCSPEGSWCSTRLWEPPG